MAKKTLPSGFSQKTKVNKNGTVSEFLQYRFTIEGKRYSVYGGTVKECKTKELEKREEIRKKLNPKKYTVSEFIDYWIDFRKKSISSATIRTYTKLLNRVKRTVIDDTGTVFGNIKLQKVESAHCEQLRNSLRKELSTRTTNDTIYLLKKVFETAKNMRSVDWNPCALVAEDRLKREEEPARDNIHRALSPEERELFLSAASESWYYNLYVFLLYTGMRIGEASAINMSDIVGGMFNVHKTVTRTEFGYEIAEQTKTSAGKRTIPVRPEARQAIESQRQINTILEGDSVVDITKPVFKMPKGGIIRPDRVNTDIKRICEKAGIEKFTSHAFRATFASICVAEGMPLKELMEIMGHADVQMCMGLYAHSNDDLKKEKLFAINF